jgi:hypothetical protein
MEHLLQSPVLVIFGAITLITVVPSLAYYWYKARKAEIEAALKHEMIQRGLSADDIERILKATSSGKTSIPCAPLESLQPDAARE